MTEYGLRCNKCDQIIKFSIDLTADEEHPDYGKRITHMSLTCPFCKTRQDYIPLPNAIIGGPDAKIQTPKVIIESAIEDLNWINVKDSPSWEKLCDALTKLEKVKEKLPAF